MLGTAMLFSLVQWPGSTTEVGSHLAVIARRGTLRLHVEDSRRTAFARKLKHVMSEKALSLQEVALRMEKELDGQKFNIVNLSHYRAGRSVPRPHYLAALSRAVGVPTELLLEPIGTADRPVPDHSSKDDVYTETVSVEALGGHAHLRISSHIPWSKALQILKILNLETDFKICQ